MVGEQSAKVLFIYTPERKKTQIQEAEGSRPSKKTKSSTWFVDLEDTVAKNAGLWGLRLLVSLFDAVHEVSKSLCKGTEEGHVYHGGSKSNCSGKGSGCHADICRQPPDSWSSLSIVYVKHPPTRTVL